MRQLLPSLAVLLCLITLSTSCASATDESLTGLLVEVRASGLTDVEQFSVRDENGQIWVFQVAEEAVDENGRALSASHLRQDMAMVDPVRIEFRREGDSLVATRVSH